MDSHMDVRIKKDGEISSVKIMKDIKGTKSNEREENEHG